MKWGEYSSDVQFILQRSDHPKQVSLTSPSSEVATKNPASSPPQSIESPKKAKSTYDQPLKHNENIASQANKNVMSEAPEAQRKNDLIGIVKGKTL